MNADRIELRRTDLYEQVWATPMRTLAKRYGISDVGLSKVCRRLDIPVPPVGHWLRRQHGYRVEQPPLPPKKEGIDDVVSIERHPTRSPLPQGVAALVSVQNGEEHRIRVPDRLTHPHPLVQQTAAAYRDATLSEYGTLVSRGRERHLALRVGRNSLSRALRIMDALIKALEARGFPVAIGDTGGTYATVLNEKVGFWLDEKVTRHDHVPTKKEEDDRAHGRWVHAPRWDYTPTELLQLKTDEFTRGGERKTWAM